MQSHVYTCNSVCVHMCAWRKIGQIQSGMIFVPDLQFIWDIIWMPYLHGVCKIPYKLRIIYIKNLPSKACTVSALYRACLLVTQCAVYYSGSEKGWSLNVGSITESRNLFHGIELCAAIRNQNNYMPFPPCNSTSCAYTGLAD